MSAGPVPESAEYEFANAAALLDPAPLSVETGVVRCPSGVLHVAARTDMPHCKARMFEWWFRWACDSEGYSWWHPLDHVSSRWVETSPQTHIGSTHIVEERLGEGTEVERLHIHFVDPAEHFGDAWAAALERGDVSGAVVAVTGTGAEPLRDERGRPRMGKMAHIARDTDEGMVLRSRFWLGEGLGAEPAAIREEVPDSVGLGLMQHAHTEFKYLARFLPSLYLGAEHEAEGLRLNW